MWKNEKSIPKKITNYGYLFIATSPPREVSKKMIEKVMKQLQVEKRLDFKRDIVMLLANTVEVDSTSKFIKFILAGGY